MKLLVGTAALTAIMALSASPAFAQGPPAGTPSGDNNPGTQHRPAGTPTAESNPGTARRLAAPGQYCKGASKKRVEGQKGTPFSTCVKAGAKLLRDQKARDEAARAPSEG